MAELPTAPPTTTPTGTNNPSGGLAPGFPGSSPSGASTTAFAGLQDWEAALILYAVGLFAIEIEDWGRLYLLGAWAVATLMIVKLPWNLTKPAATASSGGTSG